MIRRPLRPLARIIEARLRGVDPRLIEAEEKAARLKERRLAERSRAELRLSLLGLLLTLAFLSVGGKMAMIAATEPQEPRAAITAEPIINQRADIVDRNGAILATNLQTRSLYAHPHLMIDRQAAAVGLARIFPDLDGDRLLGLFNSPRKFVWIKRKLAPEQVQAVMDLGEPGLLFGPRELRLYPNGRLASHVLGGTTFGKEAVHAAEVVGVAGVELQFDAFLRDPVHEGDPLRLSLDLSVQSALEQVLAGGMVLLNAKGASAVLMEANSGRIVAMASLPDFDPNHRPRERLSGDASLSPLFNRAAQGIYELGSTFKMFTAAQMIEEGRGTLQTVVDTSGPLEWGQYEIEDFHDYGPRLSLEEVIVQSSNIGTARLAAAIGAEAQKNFLDSFGLLAGISLELPETRHARPQYPRNWSELSAMTISYGHGLAASPVHLAAAYAALVNGGYRVEPTLLAEPEEIEQVQLISERTSAQMRHLLRQVVLRGTASLAEVPGYEVGGKTGSADKPDPNGGYFEDRVIATFAGAFPMSDPQYVLVVTLDEPSTMAFGELRRTAGWTAVPVAGEIIRRIAPLLGLRPLPSAMAANNSGMTVVSQ